MASGGDMNAEDMKMEDGGQVMVSLLACAFDIWSSGRLAAHGQ